jgi:hypothetical protein
MTRTETISQYCSLCRAVVVDVIVGRDTDGWVSDTRMGDEHRKAHELRVNLEGLVHHSGAAMAIGVDVRDWALAEENAERVLRLNDPQTDEEPS